MRIRLRAPRSPRACGRLSGPGGAARVLLAALGIVSGTRCAGVRAWLGSQQRARSPLAASPARCRSDRRPLLRRRASAGAGEALFDLTLRANEAVGTGLDGGTSLLPLLPVLFAAGLVSSVNPCSAAALPAAAASVAALGQGRAAGVWGQAAAYAAGSGVVLTALGLGASALGEQLLPVGGPFQWLFPVIAVLMGLGLLGLAPLGIFGTRSVLELPSWVPVQLQGFSLGVASALGSSPCATPVLVTLVSFLATHPQGPVAAAALFLTYALGYNAPVAVAAAFAGTALPLFEGDLRWGPLLAGAAILAVGTSQLVGLGEESLLGPAPPGTLGIVMASVTFVSLLARAAAAAASGQGAPEAAPADVAPVAGEAGVYRYRPTGLPGRSLGGGVNEDGRRAALVAVCAGSAATGASRAMDSSPESPPAIIREMTQRSRPLSVALRSGRPLVVDFSATWCADCLKLAPALREIERSYGGDVEFVSLDVSYAGPVPGLPPPPDPETYWWAREFGVDGIPHLAFVAPDGRVLTALVGDVPPDILRANVEALRRGEASLPFVMYDAFEGGRRPRLPPPQAVPASLDAVQ